MDEISITASNLPFKKELLFTGLQRIMSSFFSSNSFGNIPDAISPHSTILQKEIM